MLRLNPSKIVYKQSICKKLCVKKFKHGPTLFRIENRTPIKYRVLWLFCNFGLKNRWKKFTGWNLLTWQSLLFRNDVMNPCFTHGQITTRNFLFVVYDCVQTLFRMSNVSLSRPFSWISIKSLWLHTIFF